LQGGGRDGAPFQSQQRCAEFVFPGVIVALGDDAGSDSLCQDLLPDPDRPMQKDG
jgi:hypothetical protein